MELYEKLGEKSETREQIGRRGGMGGSGQRVGSYPGHGERWAEFQARQANKILLFLSTK